MMSRSARSAILSLGILATTGCGIIEPCEIGTDPGVEGTWVLVLVDGQPIPATGAVIPGSSDRLKAGALKFSKVMGVKSCQGGTGAVGFGGSVALYDLVTSSGFPKGTRKYGAGYQYNYSTGVVTLESGGRKVHGNRFFDDLTIQPNVPLFGSAVLTFRQVSTN